MDADRTAKGTFAKGHTPWLKGTKGAFRHTEETKRKISLHSTRNMLGKKHSLEARRKIRDARSKQVMPRGDQNHAWKGGITSLRQVIYNSVEYKLWREAVFRRDNYRCVWCRAKGSRLQADHIKPFAHYPELRFDINNGRTLCIACHRTTATYGGRANRFRRNFDDGENPAGQLQD